MGRAVVRSSAPIRAPRAAYRRGLGFRAQQVLELIASHIATSGTPPSYDHIADELGFSDRSRVAHCIAGLEREGYVSRGGSLGRGARRIVLLRTA